MYLQLRKRNSEGRFLTFGVRAIAYDRVIFKPTGVSLQPKIKKASARSGNVSAVRELGETSVSETEFKAQVVWLILNSNPEKALKLLAEHYSVDMPKLRVGLPKGRKKGAFGCYTSRNKTISVLNSDILKEPFVILHEFYHHLRTTPYAKHEGTEKYADKFALEFVQAYKAWEYANKLKAK